MPYALLSSSVIRWRQQQDADDKSQMAVGSEFQDARLNSKKPRDPYHDSHASNQCTCSMPGLVGTIEPVPPRSTQPSILPGQVNQVPACLVGVEGG